MNFFIPTLNQLLMMFSLIVTGFILRKTKILPENSGTTLSRLETYVFSSALVMSTQLEKCTVQNFKTYSVYLLYGLFLILLCIALAYPLSFLFIRKTGGDEKLIYLRKVYRYGMAFGNFGFMGNFLVLGLWGADGLFKYTMFTFPLSIFCYSWGIPMLIPKEGKGFKATLKTILNPPLLAMIVGCIGGLFGVTPYIPEFLLKALDSAGECMGPVAMILAGFVIGGFDVKTLVNDKKVYFATLLRLIVLPSAITIFMIAIGASEECSLFAMLAFATPLGLNTVVYPAAFGANTKPGASMAMISHTLSVITIPLMYLIFFG